MTKQNNSKQELSQLDDNALISLIEADWSGWQFKDKINGFSFKQKSAFDGGNLFESPLWGCREISFANNRLNSKAGNNSRISSARSRGFNALADDILQFYCTREFVYHAGSKYRSSYYETVYCLYAILKSCQHVYVTDSGNLYSLRALEIFLERQLKIEDKLVLGEFIGVPELQDTYENRASLPQDAAIIGEQIFCPNCKLVLEDPTSHFPDRKYSCCYCGTNFDSKYKQQKMKERALTKSLMSFIEGNDLVIQRNRATCSSLFYTALVIFGVMVFSAPFILSFVDFCSFFLVIAIASIVLSIVFGRSKLIIRVNDEQISAVVKPAYFFIRDVVCTSQDIKQIFVRSDNVYGSNRQYSLCALINDDSELVLDKITGMNSVKAVEILQTMEVMIEKRLAIEDKNVSSEIIA